MAYYYIDAASPYLTTLAKWLIDTYPSTLDQATIILPNGVLCNQLQLLLATVNQRTSAFLPQIITIDTFLQNLGVLASEQDQCEAISERIIIAKKLTGFSGARIVWSKALAMSGQILELLEQIHSGKNDYEKIKYDLSDSPQFLNFILEFLQDLNHQWQTEIKELGKLDKAQYRTKVVEHPGIRQYLLKYNKPIIIAGSVERSTALQNFIKIIAELNRGTIILPPLTQHMLTSQHKKYLPNHGLYLMHQFKEEYALDFTKLKSLSPSQKQLPDPLGALLETENVHVSTDDPTHIKYVAVENEFEELNLVAILAKHLSTKYPLTDIAIVTDNTNFASLLHSNLARYDLAAVYSKGYPLKDTKMGTLILALVNYARHANSHFMLTEFFNLLKLEPLISENIYSIEKIVLKANIKQESQLIDALQNNPDLMQWYLSFKETITPLVIACSVPSSSFEQLLRCTLTTLEKLATNSIWHTPIGKQMALYFSQLLKVSPLVGIIETEEFYPILSLFLETQSYTITPAANTNTIAVISSNEAILSDYQCLIICECHENNWPKAAVENHWIPKHVLELLSLDSLDQQHGFQSYLFYILLNKQKIYITRAKKYQGIPVNEARFLLKLRELYQDPNKLLEDEYPWALFVKQPQALVTSQGYCVGRAQTFPTSISATNIELLARNPYGFYAKNILQLKRINPLTLEPSVADFGNIIHQIIADYTLTYQQATDKFAHFLALSELYFENSKHATFATKIWQPKIAQIAQAFIEFDELRRQNTAQIFSEIKGSITLTIGSKQQTITAIADRIELTKTGEVAILDYKTGSVPTAKEISQGIASQLLTEAIILKHGGFSDLPAQFPKECIYVKFQVQPPYIKLLTLKLSDEEFLKHQAGLVQLLDFFLNDPTASYLPTPDNKIAPTYNDYKYLSRKI